MTELKLALDILAREGFPVDRSIVAKQIRAGRLKGTLARNSKSAVVYMVDLEELRAFCRRRVERPQQFATFIDADPDESPVRIARVRGVHPTRGPIHAARIFAERGPRAARRVISSLACDLREMGAVSISRRATIVPLSRSALGIPE